MQELVRAVIPQFSKLRRQRRIWVAVTAILLSASGYLIDFTGEPPKASATQSFDLALPEPRQIPEFVPTSSTASERPRSATSDVTNLGWQRLRVRNGETLAQIFKRLGLSPTTVHKVVHIDQQTRKLARIYPGDELALRINDDGVFRALEYQLEESTKLRVTYDDEHGYRSHLIDEELVAQVSEASGIIEDSLFLAGRRAGLTDALIMDMTGLFGWDIDFVLDIRTGDSFHIIYEEIYRHGEYLRTGEILGATFINRGKTYQAVRFEHTNGVEYFAPDGRNMKKAFLRAPLNFAYISSNFNPRRFHPILKRWAAHNGIDYQAPSGTPVYAAGNGKVIASSYTKPNGNYVFVQHGNNIVTKYLHFTKRTVKLGQSVKQGQVIGYVGATGWATSPHLHYEFLVAGVHRNPRTVKLPKADPLPAEQMARFELAARPVLAQLHRMQQIQLLAHAPSP